MTDIGELDQLLIFEAESVCEDGFGGGNSSWGEHARAWAKVTPVRATETEREGAVRASTIYMVKLWQDGLDGLTEAMRIKWLQRPNVDVLLNIREIRRPTQRRMMMEIVAESGVTQ